MFGWSLLRKTCGQADATPFPAIPKNNKDAQEWRFPAVTVRYLKFNSFTTRHRIVRLLATKTKWRLVWQMSMK
jgi:hypothetical protein